MVFSNGIVLFLEKNNDFRGKQAGDRVFCIKKYKWVMFSNSFIFRYNSVSTKLKKLLLASYQDLLLFGCEPAK